MDTFAWFQAGVLVASLVVPIVALADAMRFDARDYTGVSMSRAAWLGTIMIGLLLLLGIGGWRPGTPFGPSGVIWLLTMTLVTVHFCEMRPRLVAARERRRTQQTLRR